MQPKKLVVEGVMQDEPFLAPEKLLGDFNRWPQTDLEISDAVP